MPSDKYDFKKIEAKWQKKWREEKIYEPDMKNAKRPFYNLMMFPYPSAEGLHVGNMYAFTGSDIYGRFKRMRGYDVFEPMGLDGFGIHSENYALKIKTHPMDQAKISEKRFYGQLQMTGNGFAWNERLETYDPEYYKWTQWIFTRMWKQGLAYRKKQAVNWCPSCRTVLADEQVISGECERCGAEVEKKELEQWFFRITKYAERLLNNLDKLDWSEKIKIAQRNWIGKSEGAEIDFEIKTKEKPNYLILHGYTGRADKNFIPWLKTSLENRGYQVQAPQMPSTDNPKEFEQVDYVLKNCDIDQNTIIVGHSLGGLVAMKVLQKYGKPIQGLVLIAPAVEPKFRTGKARPFWKTFSWNDLDYKKLENITDFRVILSDLAEVERKEYLEYLSQKIKADLFAGNAAREHFTAIEEPLILQALAPLIKVFTTRPDTLFGATYMVLSPEHRLIKDLKFKIKNWPEIERYINAAIAKPEAERVAEGGKKTGVELKGIKAVNPATKEEIPIWVADYVLGSYGTGAIMAVPAHDERDWEFAKKYNLPIKKVIAPHFIDHINHIKPEKPVIARNNVECFVKHWKEDKYLGLFIKQTKQRTTISGGIELGEDVIEAAKREILEETGYSNVRFVRQLGDVVHFTYFIPQKNENRHAIVTSLFFELGDGKQEPISDEESAKHEVVWWTHEEMLKVISESTEGWHLRDKFLGNENAYAGYGFSINSEKFTGMNSEKAKWEITKFVGGRKKIQYRLRDWLISRQRYWGPPIPMIYCDACAKKSKGENLEMPGWYAVPENDMPVLLPYIKDFRPKGKGESPLAAEKSFYAVKCPACKGEARRETDVSDTFLDSAWYYMRYLDPDDRKEALNKAFMKKWLPAEMYIGGAEHAVLHLLYVRFVAMAFHDWGLTDFYEPFKKFRAHGLLIKDGAKMSKSKGNVVNPDKYIKEFGADTLRMYLMFLAPFEQGGDFRDAGIIGIERFLRRVWALTIRGMDSLIKMKPVSRSPEAYQVPDDFKRSIHRTIKKVTEDIESLRYNTAISALMILLNDAERRAEAIDLPLFFYETFLKLLAPFAPHMTQELWSRLGKKTFLDFESWPEWEEKLIQEKNIELVIQVNGRVRDTISTSADIGEDEAKILALKSEKVIKNLGGKKPKKVIYVPKKLVNIVV